MAAQFNNQKSVKKQLCTKLNFSLLGGIAYRYIQIPTSGKQFSHAQVTDGESHD